MNNSMVVISCCPSGSGTVENQRSLHKNKLRLTLFVDNYLSSTNDTKASQNVRVKLN